MSAIFDTLRNFFHYIASSVSSIVNLIRRLLSILGSVFTYVSDVLHLFPAWLYVVVLVLVVICIIYIVLGRQGDG